MKKKYSDFNQSTDNIVAINIAQKAHSFDFATFQNPKLVETFIAEGLFDLSDDLADNLSNLFFELNNVIKDSQLSG